MNEITSTNAAAHANSQAGTGRLARPEMPCALAAAGSAASIAAAAPQSAASLRT